MQEHSIKFVAFSKTVMSTGGCSKTRASWTLPLVQCNVICKQLQPRKHSHNKINFATKIPAIAVNFRYCSLVLFYRLLFLTLALNIREEGHAGCCNVVTLIQDILCVIQKEKRTKQSNHFREKTSLSQSSSRPSQWKKETLALNNQLGCAWWKQHMKANFSPTILPRSGSVTQHPKFNHTPRQGVMSAYTMQPKHLLTLHTHAPPTSLFGHIWSNTFSSWAIIVMW